MELVLQSKTNMYLVTYFQQIFMDIWSCIFQTFREILMHQCITCHAFIKQGLSVPDLKRLRHFFAVSTFLMSPLECISASFFFCLSAPLPFSSSKREEENGQLIPFLFLLFSHPSQTESQTSRLNLSSEWDLGGGKKCIPSVAVFHQGKVVYVNVRGVSDQMMTLVSVVYTNQLYTCMYIVGFTQGVCAKGGFCISEVNQS